MPEVRTHPEEPSPLGLTHAQYVERCLSAGRGPSDAATRRYSRFFREGPLEFPDAVPTPTRSVSTGSPEGEVIKFLLPIPGAVGAAGSGGADRSREGMLETESVVIPMRRRHGTTLTLCVSSQIGCAMGCTFCETAQMGLVRSLSAGEIVAQWYAARRLLGHAIRNVVFMGMGEPLDNLDEVIQSIAVLTDHRGPSVGMSRITVSTAGRIDGLERLRELVLRPGWRQLNLAVSVNAPNDEVRSGLMPINRGMPLGDLVPILERWPLRRSGAICVEYVLIPGVNNAAGHAAELCELVKRVRCCVNVIPYNPRRGSAWRAPSEAEVSRFLGELESRGQFCKRRRTKGRDTMAACGQLGNERIRRRRFVDVGIRAE